MEENEKSKEYDCKVVLIGEYEAGKMGIINHFTNPLHEKKVITTIGMTYSDRKVKFDDYTVRFVIWDTSGKHEYFDLTSSIVRSTDAIIFIYDITNRETFELIEKYWYPKIKK